jgi:hypothetical protein
MGSLYTSRETAAFNLALPYLNRVNSILNNNYVEFKRANSPAFAKNLRQLYRELRPWLTKAEEYQPIKDEFEALSKIPAADKEKIWNKMEDIEMLMRQHFKDLGMLMPKITDPRFLFGNKQK